MLPLGEQYLSAWSKKYVEVDGFVKKWPLVGSGGEKTSPCDIALATNRTKVLHSMYGL